MKIATGLFDHMVVQRNRRNVSEAVFSGTCGARGPVAATVWRGKKKLKGFVSVPVGNAARGKMSGCLSGIPAGGPYLVELAVGNEKLVIRDLLVGDVWLLGGQSNMQGCGLFPRAHLPVDQLVRAFYMDDRWAPARDPVHNMWECVDQVHMDLTGGARPGKPAPDWGVCPGPAFGNEMRRRSGVPQGLIACAHGGTSMTQWDPRRKRDGGRSLYGAMIRRLVKNGGRVAGLIWYQGCSDANADAAPLFTRRMKLFVSALRRDSGDSRLPVAMVQIARVVGFGQDGDLHWNSVQEQQRRLPLVVRDLATVPAIDLPLDDIIHISGAGQHSLGARLAQAMQVLRGDRSAGMPPIELKKVSVESVRGLGVVVAEFRNVMGRLCSGSRPSGFSVVTDTGNVNYFDIQLAGRKAYVRCCPAVQELSSASLYYGRGTNPYCNIMDTAGRSLPVFGPIRMAAPHASTPFIREFRVSAFQPSAGNLDGLAFPPDLGSLQMAKRTFTEAFGSLRPEISRRGNCDEVVYYAFRFSCKEAMRLALALGYDGPVKAWLDGKMLMHDPKGTNPATPDQCVSPFPAEAGEHEIVVALGTHSGAAWGIFARLERLDVSLRQRLKVPPAYAMPEILG